MAHPTREPFMPSDAVTEKRTAPYMSFARFEGFISSLHGKPLPPRIDRTLMARMSGAEQSQLRITLRFLGLIEGEDNRVTDALRRLVAAYNTEEWTAALSQVIGEAYRPVTHDLDRAATHGQLVEHMRERGGVTGSALAKAVRFYMAAVGAARIEVSPHFSSSGAATKSSSAPRATANGSGTRRPRKPKEAGGNGTVAPQEPPAGSTEVRVPIPGKDVRIWLPSDLTDEEFAFTLHVLKTVRKLKKT